MPVRTVVQRGPKEKKVVAFGIDWPGWSRGANEPAAALELLEGYRDRFRPVARLARLGDEFDEAGALELVEDHVGVGSTDFWGISFAPSSFEQGQMGEEELDRKLALLLAAWRYFDDVAARVSPELEEGPRGGGRDRDEIVRHVVGNERGDLARRIGVVAPSDGLLTLRGPSSHREAYVAAMRSTTSREKWRGPKLDDRFVAAAHRVPRPRSRLGDAGQGPLAMKSMIEAPFRRRRVSCVMSNRRIGGLTDEFRMPPRSSEYTQR